MAFWCLPLTFIFNLKLDYITDIFLDWSYFVVSYPKNENKNNWKELNQNHKYQLGCEINSIEIFKVFEY